MNRVYVPVHVDLPLGSVAGPLLGIRQDRERKAMGGEYIGESGKGIINRREIKEEREKGIGVYLVHIVCPIARGIIEPSVAGPLVGIRTREAPQGHIGGEVISEDLAPSVQVTQGHGCAGTIHHST